MSVLDQKRMKIRFFQKLGLHSRYFIIFLARTGGIRAVEVRPQKFRANFFQFGRIVLPKNLLIWGNFAQIERKIITVYVLSRMSK
jgi:hypothetical protein